jgi:hypothetical protein
MLSHAVLDRTPALAQRLNFHGAGVYPSDVAETIIEDVGLTVRAGFSSAQRDMVREHCRFADADSAYTDSTGIGTFVIRSQIVRDVEVLGHTGAVAVPRMRALIWPGAGRPSWNLAKPRRLTPVAGPTGRAVVLGAVAHYFHFLMNDILPLLDYLDRLHPGGEPLTIIVPGEPPGFASITLAALEAAFANVRVLPLARGQKMSVDELVVLERRTANREWFLWDGAVAERLKQILLAHLGPIDAVPGRRLFVSRGNARIRRLVNEEELLRIAETRGFQPFIPQADNFAQQVAGFDQAEAAVSTHGAALTNLMWCRPGVHALELFPGNFVKSSYLWIADRMEGHHHALIGGHGDPLLGFRVEPDRFARAIDAMLESGARGAA